MKPKKPWVPPNPTVASVRDVRRLRVCHFCGNMGTELLRTFRGRGRPCFVHGYCLITGQSDGWEVFAGLPSEEIGKLTMSEWKAIGIPWSRVESVYNDAIKRDGESKQGT